MNRTLTILLLLVGIGLSGCAKGALWQLGYLSPRVRKQWAEEEQYAKTWPSIKAEMTALVEQANVSSRADQQRVARRLAEMIEKDQRILVRLHATQLLGELPSEAALASLQTAARDRESDVRVTACHAMGRLGSDDALTQLSTILRSDSNPDVQIAAARALGQFKTDRAAVVLDYALQSDQPALQVAAADSLKRITGKKHGLDIPKWRDHVASLTPAAGSSTTATQQVSHEESDEVKAFLNSLRR